MFKNYFKIALRNLTKNKSFSIINISGLAIGMAACIIILVFVAYERSFDRFHKKNIYRLNEVQKFEGMVAPQKVALTMYPMAPALKQEFPEIKRFTRLAASGNVPFFFNDKKSYVDRMCFADSAFLEIFDFPWLKGDRRTALARPNSILLTKAAAEKFFGKEEPIGKILVNYDHDTTPVVVTGVFDNIPPNSQIQFDAIIPFSLVERPDWLGNWGGNWLNTYLELAPGTNVAAVEKKFPAFLKKHMPGDQWKSYELFMMPLADVHANASDIGLDSFNYQQFDGSYTNIFFVIALIVLLIACINFMNLSTARSAERAREVGVRKSIGAFRWQLACQFLAESVLLSLTAMVLAIFLVKLLLPAVSALSHRSLQFPVFSQPALLFLLVAGSVLLGILSGLYPAGYLSSFRPVQVLKGSSAGGKSKSLFRNALVVAQFSAAIFLIISTLFALRQLSYMRSQPTGFDREQIVTVRLRDEARQKQEVIKKDLLQSSLISGVTASQDVLGSHLDQSGVEFKGAGPLKSLTSTRLIVDPDYLSVYKIGLAAGRNFSPGTAGNGKEYIVNESLANELLKDEKSKDFNTLLGARFGFDSIGRIVGVARDFNFNSLHHKIETMFMFNNNGWGYGNLSVKINGRRAQEALSFIESAWQKNCPGVPFEYEFLDDHFQELYLADSQISTIVGSLGVLAIIISCLGLFGLASYSAEKRVKEVGIRKVLGASVRGIVGMLTRDFLKYVLIAAVIAWPLSWLAVHYWLLDYAYRVDISWWVFGVAALMAMLVAFATVSFQAIKAAIANPVKSLRSE